MRAELRIRCNAPLSVELVQPAQRKELRAFQHCAEAVRRHDLPMMEAALRGLRDAGVRTDHPIAERAGLYRNVLQGTRDLQALLANAGFSRQDGQWIYQRTSDPAGADAP